MNPERRRSSLLCELSRAQGKIATLEEFIRDRERQFHSAVVRMERRNSLQGTSVSTRVRRAGLSHDMLRIRSMSREEHEDIPDEVFDEPLAEFADLTISRIIHNSDEPVPFMLRRLVSRRYHVGPAGVVIGFSPKADICLPQETELLEKHIEIKWISDSISARKKDRRGSKLIRQECIFASSDRSSNSFVLHDLTNGQGVFYISRSGTNLQYSAIKEENLASSQQVSILSTRQSIVENLPGELDQSTCTSTDYQCDPEVTCHFITNGVSFVAGRLEFSLTALPLEQLLKIQMFSAVRSGNLPKLKTIINSVVLHHDIETTSEHNQYSTLSEATPTQGDVDINSEYSSPSYSDESYFDHFYRCQRSLTHPSVTHPPHSSCAISQPQKLLLHIAIGNKDIEMITFLLEKGADPNKHTGELKQNALHLAAHQNLEEIMVELLKHGGDVEVRDSYLRPPLALTTDYEIRKLLLGVVMLCAAAEVGDHIEVERLLSCSQISPNACGLRHKNALHLASAKGHVKVVQSLVLSKANVNAKGGSHQRTPLHYASLNDHVGVAKLLLNAGANEFARDSGGYTPLNLSLGGEMCKLLHKRPLSLCLAVQSCDIVEVKRILSECDKMDGENVHIVDQRNEQSHSPLHIACATGNIAIVRVLVSHGANLNLHGGSDGWTPLFYAAMAGRDDVVEFLLSVGASTEEVDIHGKTVQSRVDKALEEVKERQSQLEKRGRAGSLEGSEMYLHTLEPAGMTRQESASSCSLEMEKEQLAHRYDALKVVSKLLISGAERLLNALETRNLSEFKQLLASSFVDANTLVDKHNPTPVLIRVCEEGLYEFAEVLLEKEAKINGSGPMSQIPLLVAAASGCCEIIQLLLDKGAKVNVQSLDTLSTPLHEAAAANSLDVVGYLLEAGADMTAQNAAGEVPFDCSTLIEVRKVLASGANRLLVAASDGDSDSILKLVKEEGISPSHEFSHGITPLHEACEGGHIKAAELLIDLGADVNKQIHSSQMTPLHIASHNNYIELARVLLKAGAKLDTKDCNGKVPFEVACTNQMRTVLVEARSSKLQPIPVDEDRNSDKCCMICMVNPINSIILPCGHQAFCTSCVSRITVCALDRQTIREVITVYR